MSHSLFDETADELRQKIHNYQITRRTAAPSLRRWLDRLIEDAESKLCALGVDVPVDDAAADVTDVESGDKARGPAADRHRGDAPAPKATSRHRNAYPLDEQAPWQRPPS